MARISGVNIPTNKRACIALTYIFGIGKTRALGICDDLGIAPSTKISDLTEEQCEIIQDCEDDMSMACFEVFYDICIIGDGGEFCDGMFGDDDDNFMLDLIFSLVESFRL